MSVNTAAAVVLVLIASDTVAQVTDSPARRASDRFIDVERGRSIDELVRFALEHEPSLAATRIDIDAAQGRVSQARLRPNPQIAFAQQEQTNGSDNQTIVGIEWPLDLWRRGPRIAAATRAVEVARYEVADNERLLAADVRRAAGEVLARVRTLRVAEDQLDAARRLSELVGARVSEGAAASLDGNQATVEVNRLVSARVIAESRAEQSLIALKRLLGLAPDAPLILKSDLEASLAAIVPWSSPPLPAVTDGSPGRTADLESMAARPDVRAAEAREALATARIVQIEREARANASVTAQYSRTDTGFPQVGFSSTGGLEPIRDLFHNVAVGVTWSLPIRNRNQGELAALDAERKAAAYRRDAAELDAQSERTASEVREVQARRALETYRTGVRAQAATNLEVLRQAYELGRTPLLDVLVEQRRYLEVEAGYTEALLELYVARVEFDRALGRTVP